MSKIYCFVLCIVSLELLPVYIECFFFFLMWLECTFLDYSYASSIFIFLSLFQTIWNFCHRFSMLICDLICPCLSRLQETDDTEEPKGEMKSPLSL